MPRPLRCPFCGDLELKVTDSRASAGKPGIRRRRECQACHRRFTTFETVVPNPSQKIKPPTSSSTAL